MRRWSWLLVVLLLWGAWMWLTGLRFTPEAAVRVFPFVRGDLIQTVPFPGGVAFLRREGDTYQTQAACRWALLFWRHCGGSSVVTTEETEEPVVESASWHAWGDEGWGTSLFAGVVRDPRIARIVWEDQAQAINGDGHFLLVRRTTDADAFPRAAALAESGQELYEWSRETLGRWRPVLPIAPPFPERSGPAAWYLPVPKDQGDWSAIGSDPGDVARRFVLSEGADCDCKEVRVTLIKTQEDRQTYLVELDGLRDDSVRRTTYLLELEQVGADWRVVAAAYQTECRRAVTPDGFCS